MVPTTNASSDEGDNNNVAPTTETRIVSMKKIRKENGIKESEESEDEALSCMSTEKNEEPPRPGMKVNFLQDQAKFEHCFKLYSWGPLIINTDGTLNRVANWQSMTEAEQASAFRLLCARNKRRVEALREAYAIKKADETKNT
jgi:hypothetical protein